MTARDEILDFLRTIARPGADIDSLADDENLVDSNIIDSLAVIQIVLYLETNHQVSMASVDPTELLSVSGILNVLSQ